MGAFPLLLLLALCARGQSMSAFPEPRTYNLYNDGRAPAHGVRALSRHRNYCAVVITKTVSCVVEDGSDTYIKPDYQQCKWMGGVCRVLYKTFVKPRYKVVYKSVMETVWRCCHGYSGNDCSISPNGASQYGPQGPMDQRMDILEQKVQQLMMNLEKIQTNTDQSESSRNSADHVPSFITQTINNIHSRMDQTEGWVEDVRRSQQEDRDRIVSLEKKLNDDDVKNRITDPEGKISSASETLVVLEDQERSRKRTEENLMEHLSRQLQDIRTVFTERLQHQTFRIEHLERQVQTGQLRQDQQDRTITYLQESLSVLKDCGCGRQTGGQTGAGQRGGRTEGEAQTGEEREKALEWWLVANEDQIRRFYTRLKDLSVSGESLYDKVVDLNQDVQQIKDLRGNRGENLEGEVMEEDPLHLHCDVCVKLEEELQKVRNCSNHTLENMKNFIHRIHIRVESRIKSCSNFQDEVRLLRSHVSMCTCGRTNGAEPTGDAGPGLEAQNQLDGHSVVDPVSVEQLKVLQGELSELFFSISSINESLKLLDDSVQKHGSIMADLGTTKDKIILELDKLQQEVTEQRELSQKQEEHTEAKLLRFEGTVLEELEKCVRTSEGLEKRMSHIESVTGRLAGSSEIFKTFTHGLERHLTSLNQSVVQHGGELELLQEQQDHIHVHMKNLNSSLTLVLKELQRIGPKGEVGYPGADLHVPRLCFSAALTVPKDHVGTIVFDKVFVNEGGFYDPETGVFTAPVDGHYFFSAVLTGHQHQEVEAVLSKSNYGMARVDSGGYQPEGLENDPMGEARVSHASLAVFSLVLPLQSGETVCIDLVKGNLAHSVEPLTTFNGVLLYELT